MKRVFKNLFFIFFIFLGFILSVDAKPKMEIVPISTTIDWNISNSLLIDNIEYKKFDDNSILCSGKVGDFIKEIFHLVKFAVPILIIVLGMIDFIKAMTAQNNDDIKKAFNKLIKRIIIGICIFILPTIIDFLLKLMEINSEMCGW